MVTFKKQMERKYAPEQELNMGKLLHLFSNQFEKLGITIKKFYLPFSLLIALFLTMSYSTIFTPDSKMMEYILNIELTIVFTVFTTTLGKILYELYLCGKFSGILFNVIALLIGATAYPCLYFFDKNILVNIVLSGLIVSEILLILYFSNVDSMSQTFSYFFNSVLFYFFSCLIVFGGVAICILAFTNLIYDFKDSYKAYAVLGEFVGAVLFGTMLLSVIPKTGQELTIPKAYKIIVSKVMLPIYVLLLSILYIYLGKILITLTFPSGQVNWFVSFSSLLFIFFAFSLSHFKEESKAIKLFLRFSGFFIIPTIIMQFSAIYIRISNYGLTTLRYASIVLNVFALVFAVMFLLKRDKCLKHSLVVLVGFVLLITATPFNIIDVPMWEQSNRLKTLLVENDMLIDNQIIPNDKINTDQQNKIIGSFNYIQYNSDQSSYMPEFLDESILNQTEKAIFGFEQGDYYGKKPYSWIEFKYDYDYIDMTNYTKLYQDASVYVRNEKVIVIYNDESEEVKGFYDVLKALYLEYENSRDQPVTTEKMEYEFGDKKLIITAANMSSEDGQGSSINFSFSSSSCYLLQK